MTNISQKWLNMNGKELEILSLFANDYSLRIHESEIVKRLNIPQRTVSRKLNILAKRGFLRYLREGKNKIYFLDKDAPFLFQLLTLIESYKSVKFLLNNLKLAFLFNNIKCGAVIFGSYARNRPDLSSDLDIVFLCNRNKEIDNIISKSQIKIHAQFSSVENLKEKLDEKDALALEIEKSHVIINSFDALIKIFMESAYG